MRLWRGLAAALALAPAALAEPTALPIGPDTPPAGQSLLTELFPGGLPFPFEAVLARLRTLAGPENVATALIPLGRSLQRYAAAPDYFASPRLVVAVTGDRAGPGAPRLADRLFLGYQPAAGVVEAISYNEAAGRFEFQEIVGYAEGVAADPAERRVCLACHQGQGPIFARPLWSESNANPAIAGRLAQLGPSFHGAPVRQTVDGLEAFDAATDRAARHPVAARLWAEACPDPACRAALLAAALRVGLGATSPAAPPGFGAGEMAVPSQDVANRDPLLDRVDATGDLETEGALDPETPRAPVVLWSPGPDGFATAAQALASELSPEDLAWIDALLRQRAGPVETVALTCASTIASLPSGDSEQRFDCVAPDARMTGFRGPDGRGRIESLSLRGHAPIEGIALPVAANRAPDGRRIGLELTDAAARITLTDDLAGLEEDLARNGGAALAAGPFLRPAVLALVASVLGERNG